MNNASKRKAQQNVKPIFLQVSLLQGLFLQLLGHFVALNNNCLSPWFQETTVSSEFIYVVHYISYCY